jgi:hypothetical protein
MRRSLRCIEVAGWPVLFGFDDAARLPGTAQLSVWQVQNPNRQARGVGQSAIVRKQVGAKVLGERHVHGVSEGNVCP